MTIEELVNKLVELTYEGIRAEIRKIEQAIEELTAVANSLRRIIPSPAAMKAESSEVNQAPAPDFDYRTGTRPKN